MRYLSLVIVSILSLSLVPGYLFGQEKLTKVTGQKWQELESLGAGFSKGFDGKHWFLLDNKRVVSSGYEKIRGLDEGRAAVQAGNHWGYINTQGQLVIDTIYDLVSYFKNGKTAVIHNAEWLFLDRNGKKVAGDVNQFFGRVMPEHPVIFHAENSLSSHNIYSELLPDQTTSTPCPPNIGIESGTFTNWEPSITNFPGGNLCTGVSFTPSGIINGRHTLISSANTGWDPYGFFPVKSPNGSNFCVRLGDDINGANGERLSYSFTVPANASNFFLRYQYAVVFDNPGNHSNCQQPRFTAKLFDQTTQSYIPCGSFEYVSDGSLPGFQISPTPSPYSGSRVLYKPWSEAFINLSQYQGHPMVLEFSSFDCTATGHFGYGYFDISEVCDMTADVRYSCPDPHITTLMAPSGFQDYHWWNFNFTTNLGNVQNLVLNPGLPIGTQLWVEVIPYNGYGCRDTLPVTIYQTLPVASFPAPAPQCFYGNSFTFSSTSTVAAGGFVSYDWDFGDGNTGTGQTVTHSYSSAGSYTVKLVVHTDLDCEDMVTHTVVVKPSPVVNAITDQTYCNGAVAPTTAVTGPMPGTVFTWTNDNPSIGLPAGGTGNIPPFAATNTSNAPVLAHIRIVPDGNGCPGPPLTFTITVNPIPAVVPVPDQNWCAGAAVPSTVLSGSVAGTSFSWTNNNAAIGLAASGTGDIPSFTAINNANTSMAGVVSILPAANGCVGPSSSYTIVVNPLPVIGAVQDKNYCHGENSLPLVLQSNVSGINFSWTNSDPSIGLPAAGSSSTIPSFVAVNSGTVPKIATISIQANARGCSAIPVIFRIAVNPVPSGNIRTAAAFICEGSSQTLTASGGSSYQWFLDGLSVPGATQPVYDATAEGTYTVRIFNIYGCSSMAVNDVPLVLRKKPRAAFIYDRSCVSFPVQFSDRSDISGAGLLRYTWDFGNGAFSSQVNPVYTYLQSGNYDVSLTVIPVDCPALASRATTQLSVKDPPAGVRYPTQNLVKNKNQLLNARYFQGANYNWVPASGLSDPSIRVPYFNYDRETEYKIQITTREGCQLTDTLLIRVFLESGIFVATAFSPNGDGQNDKLYPRLVAVTKLHFFRVYDRWGQLMFETNVEGVGWNGKYKGADQPMDSYAWVAEAEDWEGKVIKKAGVSALLR